MTRGTIHLLFGAAARAWGALAADQALQLHQRGRIRQAVAAANADTAADIPEARLAQALALARAGRHDAAPAIYDGLIQPGRIDALRPTARANPGNQLPPQAPA